MATKNSAWRVVIGIVIVLMGLLGLVWGVTDKKIDDRCDANTQRIGRVEDEQIEAREATTEILQAVARIETSQHYMREDIQEIKKELAK